MLYGYRKPGYDSVGRKALNILIDALFLIVVLEETQLFHITKSVRKYDLLYCSRVGLATV